MKAFRLILITILAAAMCACQSNDDPGRPERPKPDKPAAEDDFSTRIVSPRMSVSYEDGGTIFATDSRGHIIITRLDDAVTAEFDPSGPRLSINGREIVISSCDKTAADDGSALYKIKSPAYTDPFIICMSAADLAAK